MTENAPGSQNDAPLPSQTSNQTQNDELQDPAERDSGRAPMSSTVKILIGLVGVLALALGAAVTFIVLSTSDSDDPIAALPGIRQVVPESLKDVAERMTDEGADMERDGEPSPEAFRTFVQKYADPGCAAVLTGFVDAFGGASETSSTKSPNEQTVIISVKERGDRGTVVTRTGAGEPETTHWVRNAGQWKFTCEGMFGN